MRVRVQRGRQEHQRKEHHLLGLGLEFRVRVSDGVRVSDRVRVSDEVRTEKKQHLRELVPHWKRVAA